MKNRRDEIFQKIAAKSSVVDTGFILDGMPSPCLLWDGPTSGSGRGGGYGRVSLNGMTVAVHLVMYSHFFGFIPGNKQVDHLCNQRLCWNPVHLDLVSHKENQRRRSHRAKNS